MIHKLLRYITFCFLHKLQELVRIYIYIYTIKLTENPWFAESMPFPDFFQWKTHYCRGIDSGNMWVVFGWFLNQIPNTYNSCVHQLARLQQKRHGSSGQDVQRKPTRLENKAPRRCADERSKCDFYGVQNYVNIVIHSGLYCGFLLWQWLINNDIICDNTCWWN